LISSSQELEGSFETQPSPPMDCAQLNFLHSGDSARRLNENDFRTQTRISLPTPAEAAAAKRNAARRGGNF